MGMMYAWAKPDYLLDYMSVEEIFLYYDYGMQFEEHRAALIISKLGEALDPDAAKKSKRRSAVGAGSDKPDKKAFYARYGKKIKRPSKKDE